MQFFFKYWVDILMSNARNIYYLSLHIQLVQTNFNVVKIDFSGVVNFCVEISYARDSLKI